ncbi:MAG TPA: hypothetical protein VLA89_00250 [Gemmatimonadales bacterium]|nr:hypothetical protein [Gemmatimonadales bacterium]
MAAVIGGETTPTIGAVFISEHWAKEAQLATRKEQVLAGTVDTSYESEMRSGRTLHIAHVLNQAVTAKSDNTLVVPDTNTPTNQDITVTRYFYTATNWQSITQVQADVVDINKIAGQFGYALQGQIETDLAGLPDGLSTNVVGTFGQELTMDQWEEVWQKMQVGLAPKNDRFAWLSSAAISALRKLGTPISGDFTKSNLGALDMATIGMFLGFKIVESQYLESPATGQHDCGVHQRKQYILIRQQQPKIERDRILGDLSDLVVGWELFVTAEREIIAEAAGAESLTDQHGVWLKTV